MGGCYNIWSQTEWLWRTDPYFSRFWRLGIWDQGPSVVWWSKNLLLGRDFLLCAHMVGRAEWEQAPLSFLKRGVIPLMRALSTWPNHLTKATPPDTITLGLGVQHMNLGETQTCSPFHHWLDKCWTYMISFSSHTNSKRWELSPIYVQWNCRIIQPVSSKAKTEGGPGFFRLIALNPSCLL